jgi:hypothetical protein
MNNTENLSNRYRSFDTSFFIGNGSDDESEAGFQDSPIDHSKRNADIEAIPSEQIPLTSNSNRKTKTFGSWLCSCLEWLNPFGNPSSLTQKTLRNDHPRNQYSSFSSHSSRGQSDPFLDEEARDFFNIPNRFPPYTPAKGASPEEQSDSFLTEVASVGSEEGTIVSPINTGGIHNSGVDCYLSSALQVLKALYEHDSPEAQEAICRNLEGGNTLIGFFQGTFNATSKSNARLLRREAALVISNAESVVGEDRSNINERGDSINQADPIDSLRALLPHVGTPIRFGIKRSRVENGNVVESDTTELENNTRPLDRFIPCTLSLENGFTPRTMQHLVHGTLCEERYAYFNETRQNEDELPMINAQIEELETGVVSQNKEPSYDKIYLEKKMIDPIPSSLVVSIQRLYAENGNGQPPFFKAQQPIVDIAKPIQVPAYLNGQECSITYEPTAIICHHGDANEGHYITYKKESGDWYELDDIVDRPIDRSNKQQVFQVSQDMQSNSCVVAYVRKQDNTARAIQR